MSDLACLVHQDKKFTAFVHTDYCSGSKLSEGTCV